MCEPRVAGRVYGAGVIYPSFGQAVDELIRSPLLERGASAAEADALGLHFLLHTEEAREQGWAVNDGARGWMLHPEAAMTDLLDAACADRVVTQPDAPADPRGCESAACPKCSRPSCPGAYSACWVEL